MSENQTLPTWVVPVHYNVEINDINVDNNTFAGQVTIDLLVNEATEQIQLNTRDITVKGAELTYSVAKSDASQLITEFTYDKVNDILTLNLPTILPAEATSAKLVIDYHGIIQTNMSGFYRSDYDDNKWMLSTQFEATDARRAFPCFDEPAHKATFDVVIIADKNLTVLSNMPETSAKESQDVVIHRFETTPKMSTYLVSWVIGEFDYIESHTESDQYANGKLPVRIYTAKGLTYQAEFAMSVATRVVDYYSTLFQLPYPLPKLDMISVPSYSHNAMENWGLITFRPTALLWDHATSDPQYKEKVAYVVSHEIAHQWFGNLVTMAWWDELWLNEGFATWMGYLAVDKFFPEWKVFDKFLIDAHEVALELDALEESHAVQVAVRNAKDIDQVFDTISYLKGASVIEMISTFLGVDVFLQGVAKYLNANKYGNATMADLFGAIGEVSGFDLNGKMKEWIVSVGYPMLSVKGNCVCQHRFCSVANVENDTTTWWVPLNTQSLELEAKEQTFEQDLGLLNVDATGFYRVKYDDASLEKILESLESLSARSKMGLISDLEVASSAEKLFSLIDKIHPTEDNYFVWTRILSSLGYMKSVLYSTPELAKKVSQYVSKILAPHKEAALAFNNPEDFLKTQMYKKFLTHMDVYEDFVSKFPQEPSLVTYVAVLSSDKCTSEQVTQAVEKLYTVSLDTKEIILQSLGTVSKPDLVQQVLKLVLDEKVQAMDVHFLITQLGANPVARTALWNFFRDNYDAIYAKLSINMVVMDRFVRLALKGFAGDAIRDEIKAFFADKDLEGFDRGVRQSIERIERNTRYLKENLSFFETLA